MTAGGANSGPGGAPATPLGGILGLSVAAALVPLNSTMIAVALPAISDDFSVSTARVSVLVTLYLVVMLVGQPVAGRLADAIGSRRAVQGALLGLAAFSVLAAVATSFAVLLAGRTLQAVCATALGPGTQSLLRAAAPSREQGRVFGIFGSTMGAGAALGPVVGGLLVALFGWRGIFVVNVPIALLAALAVAATNVPLERGPSRTGIRSHSHGRIANRVFVAGFASQALTTQAQYALLLLTPIVLDARGWEPGPIGLVLAALTIGMIVTGPIGGRLGDAVGRRAPSAIGVAVAAAATVALALAGRSVDPVVLALALAVFGLGLGAATPNFMSAALGSVPEHRTGAAAGVFTTSRYVGSITTTLLIAAFVADDASGTRTLLAVSAAFMLAAVVAVRWLPGAPDAGPDARAARSTTSPSPRT